jgi:hypothetical protein
VSPDTSASIRVKIRAERRTAATGFFLPVNFNKDQRTGSRNDANVRSPKMPVFAKIKITRSQQGTLCQPAPKRGNLTKSRAASASDRNLSEPELMLTLLKIIKAITCPTKGIADAINIAAATSPPPKAKSSLGAFPSLESENAAISKAAKIPTYAVVDVLTSSVVVVRMRAP